MSAERFFAPFFDRVGAAPALRAFILTELASPTRHWHGLLHHALMLRAVVRADVEAADSKRLIRAVLFHDIVYDATRADNEEASAAVARQWLDDDAGLVATMILATKRHDLTVADAVTRLLLEADLAILWTPSATLYDFYARGIRREYVHVADAAYRIGRAKVLDELEQTLRGSIDLPRRIRLTANLSRERQQLATGVFDKGN